MTISRWKIMACTLALSFAGLAIVAGPVNNRLNAQFAVTTRPTPEVTLPAPPAPIVDKTGPASNLPETAAPTLQAQAIEITIPSVDTPAPSNPLEPITESLVRLTAKLEPARQPVGGLNQQIAISPLMAPSPSSPLEPITESNVRLTATKVLPAPQMVGGPIQPIAISPVIAAAPRISSAPITESDVRLVANNRQPTIQPVAGTSPQTVEVSAPMVAFEPPSGPVLQDPVVPPPVVPAPPRTIEPPVFQSPIAPAPLPTIPRDLPSTATAPPPQTGPSLQQPEILRTSASTTTKLKMLLRLGDGKPRFEIRANGSTELLFKVYGEKIEMPSSPEGLKTSPLTGVTASGQVRFIGPGVEGTCDQLSVLSGTGEVLLKGNVYMKTKRGKTWSEVTGEKMIYQIGATGLSTASGSSSVQPASYKVRD